MYFTENLETAKDFVPYLKQSLITAGWEILDSYKEDHILNGTTYEEEILVFKSPSGFIGYVQEKYFFYNMNLNVFGLHFNYMTRYDKDLNLYNQYGRSDYLNRNLTKDNKDDFYRLSRDYSIRKDRLGVKLFIDEYRVVICTNVDNVIKNVYIGHYLRYGTDKDIPNPSIISGGFYNVNNNPIYTNQQGVSIYNNKHMPKIVSGEYNRNNTYLYNILNTYDLNGDPIVKPKPIASDFLGEFSGVLEYAGFMDNIQYGDIYMHNGEEYMVINNVLIKK